MWRFFTLPTGWSGASARAVSDARGGVFATSGTPWAYELVSPKLTLPPGSYRAELSGDVRAGGIDVGVLDSAAGKWVTQALYSFEQKGYASKVMATRFTLTTFSPKLSVAGSMRAM